MSALLRALAVVALPALLAASPGSETSPSPAASLAPIGLPATSGAWYVSLHTGGGFAGLVRTYVANSNGEGETTKAVRLALSPAALANLDVRVRRAHEAGWQVVDENFCCDREVTTLTIERRNADGTAVTHSVSWVQAGRPIPQEAVDVIGALRSSFVQRPTP